MGRWNKVKQMSLIRQITYLSVAMLIILWLSYLISNQFAKQIIEDKVTKSVNQIFMQVEEKMQSFDTDIEGISNFLFYSPTLQAYLNTEDSLARVLGNKEVLSIFSNTMLLKENIRGIQLYDKNGAYITSLGIGSVQTIPTDSQAIQYSGLIDINISDPRNSRRSFYAVTIPVYKLDSSGIATEYAGAGRFFLDASNFSPILRSAKVTNSSQIMLLDRSNRPIAAEGEGITQELLETGKFESNAEYIVQTLTLPRSNWKLVNMIPRKELLEELDTVKRFNLIAYLIIAFITVLFLLIFFTGILNPLRELMDFIKSYPRQGGNHRFQIKKNNEIGVLGKNLNKMLDDIDYLGHEVQETQARMYEIELSKKQMEIIAFRNQINPHFLYNTLESIRAVALYYEADIIADISSSLSKMFRYAVKGNHVVRIQDEIANVREYAKIIDFRFMGRFRIDITAEEEALEENMLKMLLQPIVENAIFHGLEPKIGNGSVSIDVRRTGNGYLQFTIRDDGEGMDKQKYDKLIAQLQQSENGYLDYSSDIGIGLFNIYQRLKLIYGSDAQFRIESERHQGTVVCLAFPTNQIG